MSNNILITGSNGQLGKELQFLALDQENIEDENQFYFETRDTLDITSKDRLRNFVEKNKINIIVNCAAYTAVDRAEEDEIKANDINHLAVKYMAEIAKLNNIQLIHISTDYVFDGLNSRPYIEKDKVNPQGVYGKTKLAGENAMININPANSMIIRTSWVYSTFGNNFVKTMLRLGKERDELSVIFDQVGTPTYARDLARAILDIIQNKKTQNNTSVEVYHYSNEGVTSWYDFAKAIFEISKLNCIVNPITTEEYPTPAKRPYYSVQNKTKIKKYFNLEIPYWRDALKECLTII